jgi:hypothetical protein
MRGFDYRGNITLVIADSFDNERDAIQGLNRVGRFGDECKRITFDYIPLIHTDNAFSYKCKLTKLYSDFEIKKIE